jgi:P27 family predicted phage terminase small subunit
MPSPIIPTHLKLLRGNPGKQKLPKNEMQPRIEDTIPEPPAHVVGSACDEWYRVAGELQRLRCLTVLDYANLGAYCTAYQKWAEAEEMLAELRSNHPKGRASLITTPVGARMNPLIKISLQAAAEMVRIAGDFGFSPGARARIAMGVQAASYKEDFGPFNGLIAG